MVLKEKYNSGGEGLIIFENRYLENKFRILK